MRDHFDYHRFPAPDSATTTSTDFVTLASFPVIVGHAQPLLIDFRAAVQCQYTTPGTNFLGADFQILWDGDVLPDDVLPDGCYLEWDPGFGPPNVDSFAGGVSGRSLVPIATVGPHTVEIRWLVLAEGEEATIFPNHANLTVEGK
jgi:hypothetical protein